MHAIHAPGQQHTGRFAALDDLERYGYAPAMDLLRREGALGLFAHARPAVEAFSKALQHAGIGATPHAWNVYHARLNDTLAPVAQVLNASSQRGSMVSAQEDWGADITQRSQRLMQCCGITPASEPTLRSQVVPSLLAVTADTAGGLMGVGALVWGHCQHGPWKDYAHLGMVAVDDAARGQSLGKRLAATLIQQAVHTRHTTGITAACAADNPASAGLLRACGLQLDAHRLCVIFSMDGVRTTR